MSTVNFKSNTVPMNINTNIKSLDNQLDLVDKIDNQNQNNDDLILNGTIIETKDIDIFSYLPNIVFKDCEYIIIADIIKDLKEWPTENQIDEDLTFRVPPINHYEDNKFIINITEYTLNEVTNLLETIKYFANLVAFCRPCEDFNDALVFLQCSLIDLNIDYCVLQDDAFDLRKSSNVKKLIKYYGKDYLQGPMKRILNEFSVSTKSKSKK